MKRLNLAAVALAALLVGAGCVDSPPTAVEGLGPPVAAEAPVSELELEIAVDPELTDAVLESAEAQLATVRGRRTVRLLDQARVEFRRAREAFQAGDTARTLERARRGRTAVAEALMAGHGPGALDDLTAAVEELAMRLEESPDEFHEATPLGAAVRAMLHDARAFRGAGRPGAAGARLILAEQHGERGRWARTHDAGHDRHLFARLQVARAHEAVDLAHELLGDGLDERQARLLRAAARLAAAAGEALASGQTRRAIHLAGGAEFLALRALVAPDGVSEEEARLLAQVSERLLAAAREAVAADPTPAREWLVSLASRLHEAGTTKLEEGHPRWAAALLRHSAVTSAVLVP